ncbi:MAG: peroxiredoxin [Phycisphaerae bacterium]|jgi:peroxiredoxin Q/BCP
MFSPRAFIGLVLLSALLPACGQGESSHKSTAVIAEQLFAAKSPMLQKPAPDFTLMDPNNKPVTLSALRGKWVVLYFYPSEDTPPCVCDATEFTKTLADLRGLQAEVYGINPDTPQAHQALVTAYALELRLLSDPDHQVAQQYGAWLQTTLDGGAYGRVIRGTVIVDPQGMVLQHWPEVVPLGHAQRVKTKLAELQAQSPRLRDENEK